MRTTLGSGSLLNSTPSALFPSNRMPQSLSAVYLHLVFSTKDRHPFLTDLILRSEMHSMLGGISNQHGCIPILIGGVEDHVHILARLSRTTTQSDWVKELKRASSIWIKERELGMRDFSWQSGYGVFPSASRIWIPSATTSPDRKSIIEKPPFRTSFAVFTGSIESSLMSAMSGINPPSSGTSD